MYLQAKQDPEWSNQQIDLPAIRSSLLSQYAVSEQRYQKAVAQVSHLSGNFIDYIEKPFDVFLGSPEIKETLVSLWENYKQICEQERAEMPYQRGTSRTTGDTTKIWGLEYLKIYKVRYPVAIEYFVPPASVIVSLANDLESNGEFYALVERAARRFVQSDTDT